MTEINITYGNREGRWFTQWRFDELRDMAREIHERTGIAEFHIWYDATADFHHLAFEHNGVKVDVRLYKVFSVTFNGEDGWIGCPQREAFPFITQIQKRLGLLPAANV